jgi:hypothetical protein
MRNTSRVQLRIDVGQEPALFPVLLSGREALGGLPDPAVSAEERAERRG